jgi:alpha-methylacyl-CoA racemase
VAASDAVSANDHARPLRGIRVVTIAQNLPGPLLVARLVEQGATATKVEPPNGDPFLTLSESWYGEMHAHVPVERVDLKSDSGRDRLSALLDGADLFVTSHRPSALARLGLDPEALRARHPRLRTLRLFGSTAEPETPGHDLTYQAHSGLLRDALPQALVADVMASERGFGAAVLLLLQPEGTVVDVGLSESLEPLTACLRHGLTREGGVLGGGAPRYGVYAAKDGHVAVAALEPHFEARLYEALAQPVGSRLDDVFAGQSAAEWEAWARTRDLPIAAIVSR